MVILSYDTCKTRGRKMGRVEGGEGKQADIEGVGGCNVDHRGYVPLRDVAR